MYKIAKGVVVSALFWIR